MISYSEIDVPPQTEIFHISAIIPFHTLKFWATLNLLGQNDESCVHQVRGN